MPDNDGYPTDAELDRIKEWPPMDYDGLMEYVTSLWWHGDIGVRRRGRVICLHTWGWSGNESIIGALERTIFWVLCWQKSFRGGHYWFELPAHNTKSTVTLE